jgi:hypothetical protein
MKIKETAELTDTDPKRYVGYPEVSKETGELSTGKKKKKKKEEAEDVNDKDLHAPETDLLPDEEIDKSKPSIAPPLPEDVLFVKVVDEKGITVLKEQVTLPFLKTVYKQAQLPGYKIMWETKTHQGGVTPALFVKLYAKALSLKETREDRVNDMSDKKITENKQNSFLTVEMMNIGILKPVKGTKPSLNEINPVRKALEIYYNSPNTVDKPVPKENELVEDKKPEPEEKKETPKKKRLPIIW